VKWYENCLILSAEDFEHFDVLVDHVEEIVEQQYRVECDTNPNGNKNRAGQSIKHTYCNDFRTSPVSKYGSINSRLPRT
jgi:hypothetical protein